MILLVPADPMRPRRADEHFAGEAAAAREAGIEVAVVDHDALSRPGPEGDAAAVARVTAGEDAVYRGWMLHAGQYARLETALAARGTVLRTGAAQYRRAHELPGWYDALTGWTPESVWTDGDDPGAFAKACAVLGEGPAVLRDYSKSLKHHWDEAAFIPDVADAERAAAVGRRFRELRDDDFTGGWVLRRFERFTGAEVRTWWVGGECRLSTAHPDTPGDPPPPGFDPAPLAPAVSGLGLPFVTADLTRDDAGRWRVVEIGDGQVSDLPRGAGAAELIAALNG